MKFGYKDGELDIFDKDKDISDNVPTIHLWQTKDGIVFCIDKDDFNLTKKKEYDGKTYFTVKKK